MTKFFVDTDGKYLGGFDGDGAMALVPHGAVEAPSAPDCADQIWDSAAGVWLPRRTGILKAARTAVARRLRRARRR